MHINNAYVLLKKGNIWIIKLLSIQFLVPFSSIYHLSHEFPMKIPENFPCRLCDDAQKRHLASDADELDQTLVPRAATRCSVSPTFR